MKILAKSGSVWGPADLASFGVEADLEELLVDDTSLIPGCKGSVGVTQFPLAGGRADIVCLDEHGTVTIVECKLQTNREARRTVVGQLMAYAASLAEMEGDDFLAHFAKRLGGDLVKSVSAAAGHEVSDQALRAAVREKLSQGTMRLVVAVDSVADELRSVIEFLATRFGDGIQIVALEVGYLNDGGVELLALNSFGNDVEDAVPSATKKPGRKWTREEVEAAIGSLPGAEAALVQRLLGHADKQGAVFNGGVGPNESAGFYYLLGEKRRSLWSFWAEPGKASIAANIGSVNGADPELAERLVRRLISSPYFAAKLGGLENPTSRFPTLLLSELVADPQAFEVLIEAFDGVLDDARSDQLGGA